MASSPTQSTARKPLIAPLPRHAPPPGPPAGPSLQALDKADQLFEEADVNGDGKLCLKELYAILNKASEEFPHLSEHARFLDG
jgi:hypothetical protein